jgi:GPI mannosyltransferase 3
VSCSSLGHSKRTDTRSNPFEHVTQQALFYSRPVTYLQHVFPNPPVPLHRIPETKTLQRKPSHVVLFGTLLDSTESIGATNVTIHSALHAQGYQEVWNGWNGFDFAQDEEERRGGVRIWRLFDAA